MLHELLGAKSSAAALKEGLTESSRSIRVIAHRVANATTGAVEPFATVLEAAEGSAGPVDVEAEMVRLADEQIRFEAAARLLEKVYAQVRSSVRER